jgi:hypothetical protein
LSDLIRIEQQISQLVSMVAKNNQILLEMKSEILEMKSEISAIKSDLQQEKETNQSRYEENKARDEELLMEIRNQKYIINHHRSKIAKNEEEISLIKQIVQS